MNIPDEIAKMERTLRDLGLTAKALCDRAEINTSTWQRWKTSMTTPNVLVWWRVQQEFAAMAASKTAGAA